MSDAPGEPNWRYTDLREWIREAERLGELRAVLGATWQEEIGLAADVVIPSDNGPAVLFDEVPGCPKGFRLLINVFAGKRRNMTLGEPACSRRAAGRRCTAASLSSSSMTTSTYRTSSS